MKITRILEISALAVLLACTVSSAGQAPGSAAQSSAKSLDTSSQIEALQAEIHQLKQMIESQQQRLDKLESETDRASEGGSPTMRTASSPAPAVPDASAAQVLQAAKESPVSKLKQIGPLAFSGDLRLRHESFFGGGLTTGAASAQRNRERYRLRFNALAKLNDEFTGGFTLASGDLGDPISTNTTETGFFTRTPIAVDRAFLTYSPKYWKPLHIVAGKFAYTWDRTELTWDNDINVEGSSQVIEWNWRGRPLSHFALVAFELPLYEVSNGPDSAVLGGQVQSGWDIFPALHVRADAAFYDYRNPNSIATNQTGGNGWATQGISTGQGGTFGFSSTALTNSAGIIGTTREFVSRFGIVDSLLELDFNTGIERFPLVTLFNFEQNTRACQNRSAFLAAGVAVACNPRDRQGYWAEARFGENTRKHDLLFDYVFARIEREATVAAFVASDFRQPTNLAQHRFGVGYVAYPAVLLDFTTFIGRQLVTAQTPTPERWLTRMQMDVSYKF